MTWLLLSHSFKLQKPAQCIWHKPHRIHYHPMTMIILEPEQVPGTTNRRCFNWTTQICVTEAKQTRRTRTRLQVWNLWPLAFAENARHTFWFWWCRHPGQSLWATRLWAYLLDHSRFCAKGVRDRDLMTQYLQNLRYMFALCPQLHRGSQSGSHWEHLYHHWQSYSGHLQR